MLQETFFYVSERTWTVRLRYGKERLPPHPVKIDLDVDIKNFGPVTRGTLNIKPLTIFIGPNNSGKSYVAMLIHSILSSVNKIKEFGSHVLPNQGQMDIYNLSDEKLKDVVNKNKGRQSFAIPAELVKEVRSNIIQSVFGDVLESSIRRNFGSTTRDLVRAGQRNAKVTVHDSVNLDIKIGKKLSVTERVNAAQKEYEVNISPKGSRYQVQEKSDANSSVILLNKSKASDFFRYDLAFWLVSSISRDIAHDNIPSDSFYFPAARSGMLQGHKALSASIIKSAPFGGIEPLHIPNLTGVVSDFISEIILIPRRPGPLFKLAKQLEEDLLHGHIKLSSFEKETFPEIVYRSEQGDIPLHRTSSTISEIAPFTLYLKYIVDTGNMLVIEEPEAHLHPKNQLIFAEYIVKMIRRGLNVLVTTHSVFLLEQLNQSMLASRLPPDLRKKQGFGGDDSYLLPEEIATYVFKDDGGGHRIVPVKTDDEEGISQEEFIEINEYLYSKSVKLSQNLPEN